MLTAACSQRIDWTCSVAIQQPDSSSTQLWQADTLSATVGPLKCQAHDISHVRYTKVYCHPPACQPPKAPVSAKKHDKYYVWKQLDLQTLRINNYYINFRSRRDPKKSTSIRTKKKKGKRSTILTKLSLLFLRSASSSSCCSAKAMELLRSICDGRWMVHSRRILVSRSTSVGTWTTRPKWSHRSRLNIYVLVGRWSWFSWC